VYPSRGEHVIPYIRGSVAKLSGRATRTPSSLAKPARPGPGAKLKAQIPPHAGNDNGHGGGYGGYVGGVGVMTMLGGAIAASSIARAVAAGGAGSAAAATGTAIRS
jgi:hypothetical protein